MKRAALFIILIGVFLFFFNFFPYQIEHKTFSDKNVEISPSRDTYNFVFPRYIGAGVAVVGLLVLFFTRKKNNY